MTRESRALAQILRHEGWPKYTNRPNDIGSHTKGGVTLVTLREWRCNPAATVEDLKALTRDEAEAIYAVRYLQPFATIKDDDLYLYLTDLSVLRGPRKAVQMVQEIVGVEADGWIGPETLTAMSRYAQHLIVMLIGSRFTHIAARVRENPTQQVFRDGWRNRNDRFLPV